MENFKKMVNDIVLNYQLEMGNYGHQGKMKIIEDMTKELAAMRAAWEVIYPTNVPDYVSFEQMLKEITS